jgi:5-methyltetrahydropteroyltriglutamate--homocysteine methyltransferase
MSVMQDTKARTKPPFRADHVGSLLRTAALKEARTKHAKGEISAAELKAVEDQEITRIIRKQEEVGLKLVTDGEFRRSWWQFDFMKELDGLELYNTGKGIQFHGVTTRAEDIRVSGRIGYSGHPMIDHFRFVAQTTRVTPKMTIPSPTVVHFRVGQKPVSDGHYPSMDDFFADLGAAYNKTVLAFAAAGCRYLQLDDTSFAHLCDKDRRQMLKDRGEDPDQLMHTYAKLINAAIAGVPPDMVIGMHLCRGNFRSTFISSGGYEPVADVLFNKTNVNAYFLEYDTDRAGGFEPLRFLPKGKHAVLGLITSKFGTLESKDDIRRRIDEAAKHVALDQLCLSPQCGFASTEEGNTLAEDEQWAKLARIVEIADAVWG